MLLVDLLLPEFDHEMAATRRVLERAPESHFGWRPHDKSWTIGGLATHLAHIPRWGVSILKRDGYDVVRDATHSPTEMTTAAEILAAFDQHVDDARSSLTTATDGELMLPWSFRRDGVVLMSVPRIQAFKRFALNHVVHHRGQLTVYLRLQDVPLPPLYGPTADEGA